MKSRKKTIFLVVVIFFILFFSNLILSKSNRNELKGDIVVWTEEAYYNYFLEISNEFNERNKKVNIEVISINKENYLEKVIKSDEKDLPNILTLNFIEIDKVRDKIKFFEENNNIIETYNKNFKDSRLQEVKIDNDYYGIPFESNPIALYVRSDILAQYGYEIADINTWNDLIKIGTEIKAKTSGQFNLFSNEDKDNINLLITAQLVDSEHNIFTNENIIKEIDKIYNNEFITDSDNYLFRVSSLDFYKHIISENTTRLWEAKNPPSYNIGENKLYDLGGKNLVTLNLDKNTDAIREFIIFASSNNELLAKELLNNRFIPSSLYALNIKESEVIKESVNNISPFLTLVNIVERAPSIKNYDRFKEIIIEL